MIPIEENKRPIKVDNYLIPIKECKSGRFSEFKKIVLSELLYMYSNINPTGELMTYENKTYHFSFIQKELAFELKKDTKDMCRAMKWLQNEGYISYFAPKSTYVTINEEYICSKIKSAGKISFQNNEEIDNKPILTIIEVTEKEQSSIVQSIIPMSNENTPIVNHGESKYKKIFGKEQLKSYLSNDKIVHFNKFREKGYKPESTDYRDIVNTILQIYKAYKKNNFDGSVPYYNHAVKIITKIFKNDQESNFYMKQIDTMLAKKKRNLQVNTPNAYIR